MRQLHCADVCTRLICEYIHCMDCLREYFCTILVTLIVFQKGVFLSRGVSQDDMIGLKKKVNRTKDVFKPKDDFILTGRLDSSLI